MALLTVQPALTLLDYSDYSKVREVMQQQIKTAVTNTFPVKNDRYTITVDDLHFTGPMEYTPTEQKRAIIEGRTLVNRLAGRYQVTDTLTNKPVSKTSVKGIVNIPYLTDRGTFIVNGSERTIAKQFRLTPGVYIRATEDGNYEAQFNFKPRTGTSFRMYMEPATSLFYIKYGGHKIPLFPVMQRLGYDMEDLRRRWGQEIFTKNEVLAKSPHAISWLNSIEEIAAGKKTTLPKETLILEKEAILQSNAELEEKKITPANAGLKALFNRGELEPEGVELTLGKRFEKLSPEAMALATSHILSLSRRQRAEDDRDSLQFQTIHDAGDFIAEKIQKDQGGLLKKLLWKLTKKNGDANSIPPAVFDTHVHNLFTASGLSSTLEGINPVEMYDLNQRVVRLGEGAISSIESVPEEARNVQPSYFGFVDGVRGPESLKVGVDLRLAQNARKGADNLLYSRFIDTQTGQPVWINTRQAARSIIGFPGASKSLEPFVPALFKGRMVQYVPKEDVVYEMERGDDAFSVGGNTIPLKSGVKAMRLLMAAKHATAALPLVTREAPLVQTVSDNGVDSVEQKLGKFAGASFSPYKGTVKEVLPDRIIINTTKGDQPVWLYDNFPHARKTFIRSILKVKVGQAIKPGDLLSTSNFTNDKGTLALGTNLRIGYMNYDGKVFEDAVVISESAAEKLTSEHLYPVEVDEEEGLYYDKKKYQALFPSRFSKEQLATLDSRGVVLPGTQINPGDPLIATVREKEPTTETMGRRLRMDETTVWEHPFPGVVTETAKTKTGYVVYVRANLPMQEGDKLTSTFGNKGVVSSIIKDEEMPKDEQGRPLEIIMSPLGIISRTNSAQAVVAALGKVAAKTGVPYVLPGFMNKDMVEFAQEELAKAGVSDTETVMDPRTRKNIPGVFTGVAYIYKLQQTAESKGRSRSVGSYTMEEQPAKGGGATSKRLGDMEYQSILAYGGDKVLRDLKIIKGQRNDDFWRQLKLGQTPSLPGVPLVYTKFKSLVRAAGVELREEPHQDYIFAMTDKKAKELTGNRKITKPVTYSATNMKPLPGGLFDPVATGSENDGSFWSYIELPEPMPNPVMEDPLRSILRLTRKQFDSLVQGDVEIDGYRGPAAVQHLLGKMDMQAERSLALEEIKTASKSKRDGAIKRYGYIEAMVQNEVKPTDFLMTRVPVLPPRFRPIVRSNKLTMVADPNYLYKTLMEAIEDFGAAKELPLEMQNKARQGIHSAYRTLVGTMDPVQPQLQQKNVEGILSQLFGKGSPKYGFFHRRVLGTNLDMTGLSVITPNPSLRLNEVGLPEELAWDLYEPFIIRNLVQQNVPAVAAARAVEQHSPLAYTALKKVIGQRPVLINRAPTLHKYSILAMWPVLTKGHTLQIPPTIVKPLNADFDGDTASYSVPVTDEAVAQAIELMLPEKNLLSVRNDRPNFQPTNEYMQGLWLASKQVSRNPVRYFNTREDALKAYRRGDLAVDDPIMIKE